RLVRNGDGSPQLSGASPVTIDADFWQAHAPTIRVLNGVDHATAVHPAGERFAFTGNIREGSPHVGGLVALREAARTGQLPPMPFVSSGGTDPTANLLAVTRIPSVSVLQSVGAPTSLGGNHTVQVSVEDLIISTQAARDARLLRASEATSAKNPS